MLRALFVTIHVLLAGYFIKLGLAAYQPAGTAWDVGVIPIFCAFWFLFAALSFYLQNAWMVTMFTFSMGGISLLYLFIGGITEFSMYGMASDVGGATMPLVGAFFAFLIFGQIYAMIMGKKLKHDKKSGSGIQPR